MFKNKDFNGTVTQSQYSLVCEECGLTLGDHFDTHCQNDDESNKEIARVTITITESKKEVYYSINHSNANGPKIYASNIIGSFLYKMINKPLILACIKEALNRNQKAGEL